MRLNAVLDASFPCACPDVSVFVDVGYMEAARAWLHGTSDQPRSRAGKARIERHRHDLVTRLYSTTVRTSSAWIVAVTD